MKNLNSVLAKIDGIPVDKSSRFLGIMIIVILLISSCLMSCKQESVSPEVQDNYLSGVWEGKICGNLHTLTIVHEDTAAILYGNYPVTVLSDSTFESNTQGVTTYTGKVVDGKLEFCQKQSGISCCGILTKVQ